jgi:hypothetical protein
MTDDANTDVLSLYKKLLNSGRGEERLTADALQSERYFRAESRNMSPAFYRPDFQKAADEILENARRLEVALKRPANLLFGR